LNRNEQEYADLIFCYWSCGPTVTKYDGQFRGGYSLASRKKQVTLTAVMSDLGNPGCNYWR